MNLSKVTLPEYTKKEEILNAVSHALGIPLGIVFGIACVLKADQVYEVIGSAILSFSAVVLYTCSTLYHSLKKSDAKKIMRILDHSTIFLLITGSIVAVTVIFVYPYVRLTAVILSAVCISLSVFGTVLTVVDQEKYKKHQQILYVAVGFLSVFLVQPIYKYCSDAKGLFVPFVFGGLVYLIGMAFYHIGKKKRYFHFVFHLFVLAGTVVHFLTIYLSI